MTVKFFAYLRDPEFANCKELHMAAVPSVWDLGRVLSDRFGPKFQSEFFSPDSSQLGERVIIMVNGRRVEFLDGIHTPLTDADTVLVFPVVAGG